MPISFKSLSGGGIPFGDNAGRPDTPGVGQPFFNGDAARLELYTTATGWQNIVQETPAVVNIVGSYYESLQTNTLTINGTNFATGAAAYAIGTNGVEIQALTTSLVSVVEISATFSGLSRLYEPYDIKVVNPSNLYGILYETLQIDDTPVWNAQSGTLGTYIEQSPMSVSTGALDDENQTIQYSVSSGSLPGGLSIDSATGIISGTPADIIPNTTYSFTLDAFDGNNHSYRNYSISITDRGPTWSTGTNLPAFTKGAAYSTTVVAVDDNAGTVSYSLASGSLPLGMSLTSSTGVISGTPTSSTNVLFTIRATDPSGNYTDKQFSLLNVGPVFTQTSPPSYVVGSPYSYTIVATDDSGSSPTYQLVGSLPSGLSLNASTGAISGTPTVSGESVTFSITATDANNNSTSSGNITISDFSTAYIPISLSEQTFSGGSYSTYTIPTTGSYELEVAGSSGGWSLGLDSTYGGDGRVVTIKRNFFAGTVIKYAVGNYVDNYGGNSSNGGGIGGGGTFIYLPNDSNTLLVAAGGGGGGSINNGGSAPYWYGEPGQPLGNTSGSPARNGQAGGSNGGDGTLTSGGVPGRGWNYLISNNFPSQGSTSYHGNGFGGGGTSADHAGGGGGGYSGGGTGAYSTNTGTGNSDGRNGGGGGGTYVISTGNRSAVDSGLNPSQGYFKIRAASA